MRDEIQNNSLTASSVARKITEGVLEFPKPEDNTNSITLIIKGIANVPERIFMGPVER
jgi:hypothetical protein